MAQVDPVLLFLIDPQGPQGHIPDQLGRSIPVHSADPVRFTAYPP